MQHNSYNCIIPIIFIHNSTQSFSHIIEITFQILPSTRIIDLVGNTMTPIYKSNQTMTGIKYFYHFFYCPLSFSPPSFFQIFTIYPHKTKKTELRPPPPPALSTVRSSLFASLALFVHRSTTRVTRHLAYTVSYKHLQFISLKCNFGSSTK